MKGYTVKPVSIRGQRRGELTPMDELEEVDLGVKAAAKDECDTMFCPDTHPKPHSATDDPVTDDAGNIEAQLDAFDDGFEAQLDAFDDGFEAVETQLDESVRVDPVVSDGLL